MVVSDGVLMHSFMQFVSVMKRVVARFSQVWWSSQILSTSIKWLTLCYWGDNSHGRTTRGANHEYVGPFSYLTKLGRSLFGG